MKRSAGRPERAANSGLFFWTVDAKLRLSRLYLDHILRFSPSICLSILLSVDPLHSFLSPPPSSLLTRSLSSSIRSSLDSAVRLLVSRIHQTDRVGRHWQRSPGHADGNSRDSRFQYNLQAASLRRTLASREHRNSIQATPISVRLFEGSFSFFFSSFFFLQITADHQIVSLCPTIVPIMSCKWSRRSFDRSELYDRVSK